MIFNFSTLSVIKLVIDFAKSQLKIVYASFFLRIFLKNVLLKPRKVKMLWNDVVYNDSSDLNSKQIMNFFGLFLCLIGWLVCYGLFVVVF